MARTMFAMDLYALLEWLRIQLGRRLSLILCALVFTGRVSEHVQHPARVLSSRAARMASKGLRGAAEGSSIGPWERTASPDAV